MNTPPSTRSMNLSEDALEHAAQEPSYPEVDFQTILKTDHNSILSEINGSKIKFKTESLSTIVTNKGKEFYNHWTVNYCTGAEDIEGLLFFSNDTLNFIGTRVSKASQTVLSSWLGFSRKNEVHNKRVGDFRMQINIHDIAECVVTTFSVPSIKSEDQTDKSHIVQFNLLDHGDFKLDETLDQAVSNLRDNNKAYACVYFSLKSTTVDDEEVDQTDSIVKYIQSKFKKTKEQFKDKERLSDVNRIPYFELLTDFIKMDDIKILKETKKLIRQQCDKALTRFKQNKKRAISPEKTAKLHATMQARKVPSKGNRMIIVNPIVLDDSDIVDMNKFAQIVSYVPDIYHSFEWKMVYSSTQHGTSYNNMLRRVKNVEPFLVIIKDSFGNIFGAFGNDDLKFSEQYYGSGETFIYSFKKNNDIKAYTWAKKNDMFIYANDEGFMFGAGPFYGLWIDCELTRGRTHMCETFNNQLLSDNADFNIAKIEVWSVIDPLSGK